MGNNAINNNSNINYRINNNDSNSKRIGGKNGRNDKTKECQI